MRCEQIRPYLPGFAGGDLREDTVGAVRAHLSGCASCGAEAADLQRVTQGLALVGAREVEPPAYLLDSLLESVPERARRLLPLSPLALGDDLTRAVRENKEAIASAAGAAVIAAGAAYALWRAVKGRGATAPATTA